ncbi:Cu-dependent DNA-binding protein, putative [Penicillium digitatum PHI26]|uniref:Cu-dependent DNA-binding protein, putative n=2 Tax=Penicillium digitatum TaxID=36651 RepID=K9FNC0_PEND2|nr:Cu-dependent DNA-binding protein, putative [Penicillium digitatum Pd1]EKV04253.1 Cu-dependent DNA-binding protein, putative [Penicillium digitatum PHI26]EKV21361.1 Cu-dependent DNA-binding protein, putative [Penicillium digitatum Pd1]
MLIDGQKWACEACLRGHRVTSCKHHGEYSE